LTHAALSVLPGVTRVDAQAGGVRLITADAEATARALLLQDASVAALEIRSAGLEEAFLALTNADTANESAA
jgi:ABC-2 type transport system ATP-binding protein